MCKDSYSNDWIYVIKQGQCRVLKKVKFTKRNPLLKSLSNADNANSNFIEIKKVNVKEVFVSN